MIHAPPLTPHATRFRRPSRRLIDEPGAERLSGRTGLATQVVGLLSGLAVAVAWWVPGTPACAVLGWVSAVLLVSAVRARRAYLPSYLAGLACCSLGFYWILPTLAGFGGFGVLASAALFAAYSALTALQFVVFAFLYHNLGPRFDAFALKGPTAIVVSELVSVRLFFWHYGHTQSAFTPFAQAAGLGGALLVSFLMFWLTEAVVRAVVFGERRRSLLAPLVACAASLAYGAQTMSFFAAPRGEPQDVIVVQANAKQSRTFDPDEARRSVVRFHELSREAAVENALIVWPEGAIPHFFPDDLGSARNEPVVPWLGGGTASLFGAYASGPDGRRFNAAFAVRPDGTVPRPYHKQILIPFGEAIPFASTFPWLARMNEKAGVFSPGDAVFVFDYPMRRPDGTAYSLELAPLICYEDTVPSLSREATRKGARLLVNLTYDTWFGRTVAAAEHHLIASFRAIENRRYLVRATNSGLSAVVDPLGRTVARLPAFEEGTLKIPVRLLDTPSVYTDVTGDAPWWSLAGLAAGSIVVAKVRRRRSERLEA